MGGTPSAFEFMDPNPATATKAAENLWLGGLYMTTVAETTYAAPESGRKPNTNSGSRTVAGGDLFECTEVTAACL